MKVIIFDFDGTIADSLKTMIDFGKKVSVELGYGNFNKREIEKMRDNSPKYLMKKFRVPFFKFPIFLKRYRSIFKSDISSIKMVKNMKETILKLKKRGYKVGVITSNSNKNVSDFLVKNGIDVDFIHSDSTLFGKYKVIRNFLRKNKIIPNQAVYIGDEIGDIEAAKKNSIRIISVTWGLNSKKGLEKYKPDFIIDNPNELLKILD